MHMISAFNFIAFSLCTRRWLEFMNDVHDCDISIIFHGNHLQLLWFHNIRFIHTNLVLGYGDTEKTPIFLFSSLRSSHWSRFYVLHSLWISSLHICFFILPERWFAYVSLHVVFLFILEIVWILYMQIGAFELAATKEKWWLPQLERSVVFTIAHKT